MGTTLNACCNQGPGGSGNELQITPLSREAVELPLGAFRPCEEIKTVDSDHEETLKQALKYRRTGVTKNSYEQSSSLWMMEIRDSAKIEQIYCRGALSGSQIGGEVTIYFPKGEIFQGLIANRQPKEGAFVFKKGCFYVGDIVKLNAQGFGRFENHDAGYCYEGTWSKSLPHGKGIQTYRNGDQYEGQLMYGEKFGFGKYKFADGKLYEGTFYYNQSDGKGTMIYPNSDVYEGEWKLGKFNGKGKFTWKNGEVYEGEYEGGIRNGRGKYTFRNGSYYDGEWRDGVQSGRGVFHQGYDDVEGQWALGTLIS